jgi:hypothetical protein
VPGHSAGAAFAHRQLTVLFFYSGSKLLPDALEHKMKNKDETIDE